MKFSCISRQVMLLIGIGSCTGIFGSRRLLIHDIPKDRCDKVIKSAVAAARKQHKRLFVKFGSSWCRPCRELDTFLNGPEMLPILKKNFELLSIHFNERDGEKDLETPGTREWIVKAGMEPVLPVFCILDEEGHVVTSSLKPSKVANVAAMYGEPFSYDDIPRFLHFLSEGSSGVSKDDLKAVRLIMERDIAGHKGS